VRLSNCWHRLLSSKADLKNICDEGGCSETPTPKHVRQHVHERRLKRNHTHSNVAALVEGTTATQSKRAHGQDLHYYLVPIQMNLFRIRLQQEDDASTAFIRLWWACYTTYCKNKICLTGPERICWQCGLNIESSSSCLEPSPARTKIAGLTFRYKKRCKAL